MGLIQEVNKLRAEVDSLLKDKKIRDRVRQTMLLHGSRGTELEAFTSQSLELEDAANATKKS